jgi:hypothetical protein
MSMDDLVTWLRAQLDDDERAARAELTPAASISVSLGLSLWEARDVGGPEMPSVWEGTALIARDLADEHAQHIARWDPVRVLAEVDARRQILELHAGEHDCPKIMTGVYADDWPASASWGKAGESWRHATNEHFEGDRPCPTLRAQGLPYADRDGYREEWRPMTMLDG